MTDGQGIMMKRALRGSPTPLGYVIGQITALSLLFPTFANWDIGLEELSCAVQLSISTFYPKIKSSDTALSFMSFYHQNVAEVPTVAQ